ncbi:MAG: hypothetical protein ACLPID_17195 [Beijerinckiaceae bacterium]
MFDHFSRPLLPFAAVALIAGCAFAGSAQAESVQKQCSEKYQAAKTANTLNGQTWNQFYKQCSAELKAGNEPATSEPPAEQKTATPPPQKTTTPTQPKKTAAPAEPMPAGDAVFPTAILAEFSKETPHNARLHTCSKQYQANKATNSNGGMKWTEKGGGYYSECNKKLKGGA